MITSRQGFHFTRKYFALTILTTILFGFSKTNAQQTPSFAGEPGMARVTSALRLPSVLTTSRTIPGRAAAPDTNTIRLTKKFFGSQKFVYGENEPQNVYDFIGISYRGEFRDVLATHPAALKEANKASTYNVVRTLGTLTLLGMSVKLLLDSINDAQDVSAGRFPDEGSGSGDLAIIAVAGGVTIVSGILGKKHLKNGVKMFNEKQKQQTSTSKK